MPTVAQKESSINFKEMFEPGEPKEFEEPNMKPGELGVPKEMKEFVSREPGELKGEFGEPKEPGEPREVLEPGELGGLSPGLSQSRGASGGEKTTSYRVGQ